MTTERCSALRADGEPCQAPALLGRDVCLFHDPRPEAVAVADAARRKGGRHTAYQDVEHPEAPPERPQDALDGLQRAIGAAWLLPNSVQRGQLLSRLYEALIRSIGQVDLEKRITELEEAARAHTSREED